MILTHFLLVHLFVNVCSNEISAVGDVVICKWILCKFTDNTIKNTNKITIISDNIGNRHLELDSVGFCRK